jgi:benzoyl-CoA reductase/2-hydroxyglutaryl-CoA dehydratase subunit BcrC/BadD/HgdB
VGPNHLTDGRTDVAIAEKGYVQESAAPEEDRPRIGWVCSYTPEEIIMAAGCQPVRLSGSGKPIAQADAYLHANVCPYVRGVLDQTLEGAYHLDGVVFVNSCDAMRRLHDVFRAYLKPRFSFIIDMPRWESPASLAQYTIQLRELMMALAEAFGGGVSSEDRLLEAIRTVNRTRALLQTLYSYRRSDPPAITGTESLRLVMEATTEPKADFNRALERYLAGMPPQGHTASRPRLMLCGSIIDRLEITDLIEETGSVVIEDLCTGHRYLHGSVQEEGDPYQSVARRYLERVPCSRMTGLERRLAYVRELIDQYHVEGVIYHALKFCDQFQYDYPTLRQDLEEMGIPVLYLEGDYNTGGFGQMKTRVQAFVEMLGEM